MFPKQKKNTESKEKELAKMGEVIKKKQMQKKLRQDAKDQTSKNLSGSREGPNEPKRQTIKKRKGERKSPS